MTFGKYWYDNWEDHLEAVTAPAGLSYRKFVEKVYLKGEDRHKKYEDKGFKTASGKVELSLSQAANLNVPALPDPGQSRSDLTNNGCGQHFGNITQGRPGFTAPIGALVSSLFWLFHQAESFSYHFLSPFP